MDRPKLVSWGVRYHPGIPHAEDYGCQSCHTWYYSPPGREEWNQIVGFSLDDPWRRKFGIIIIECPNCFEKFWVHVFNKEGADSLRGLCKNWPKGDSV